MSDRPIGDEIDRQLRSAMDDLVEQAPLLPEPKDLALHQESPQGWERPIRQDDDLIIEYLVPRDETKSPAGQKRRNGAIGAVAAAILVVVGVVVLANGDIGDVATDPVSSPGVDGSVPSSERSGVTEEQPVFGVGWMASVTVGGPGLVAVGDSGSDAAVWTSVDGTWSRVPHDEAVFGGASMASVTVGGPGLVAVGVSGVVSGGFDEVSSYRDAAVWTSVDGIAWSRVPHDEEVFGGASMSSVIAAGPGLVAVGSVDVPDDLAVLLVGSDTDRDAAVWTSVDGIAWSRVPHDESVFGGADIQSIEEVIVGGPGLVAVGKDGVRDIEPYIGLVAAVWTSVDGLIWSRVPHDEAVFGQRDIVEGGRQLGMSGVTAGGPGVVAIGEAWPSSAPGLVWTSVDGITWSRVPRDEETFAGGSMTSVTAGGPGLVAVGPDAAVWTSVDGITWSRLPGSSYGDGRPLDPGRWRDVGSVITTGSGLVAVGGYDRSAAVWTSVDGVTWSRVTPFEASSAIEVVVSALDAKNSLDLDGWLMAFEGGKRQGIPLFAEEILMNANERWEIVEPCQVTDQTVSDQIVVKCVIGSTDDFWGAGGIVDIRNMAFTVNADGLITYSSRFGSNRRDSFNRAFHQWLSDTHPDVYADMDRGHISSNAPGFDTRNPEHMLVALEYTEEFVAQSDTYPLDPAD